MELFQSSKQQNRKWKTPCFLILVFSVQNPLAVKYTDPFSHSCITFLKFISLFVDVLFQFLRQTEINQHAIHKRAIV